MTGAEHYAEGERLLVEASKTGLSIAVGAPSRADMIQLALAHFYASGVAASVVNSMRGDLSGVAQEWEKLVKPK